jgi:hypothetical protein
VDVEAGVAVFVHRRGAGVQTHPDAHPDVVGPVVLGDAALRGERGGHGGVRVLERGEDLVGPDIDRLPTGGLDRLALEPARVCEDVGVSLAEHLHEPRRVLEVGEEEGEGARGTAGHRGESRGAG